MTAAVTLLAGLTAWLCIPASPLRRLEPPPNEAAHTADPTTCYPLWWRIAAGCIVAAGIWVLRPGAELFALAAGGIVFGVSRWVRKPVNHDAEQAELPDALEFLAVCLDSGAPIRQALATVVEVSPSTTGSLLRRVLAHLDVGRASEDAWAELAAHPVWGVAAKDMVRSARSGVSLADTLRLHAADARIAARDAAMKRARKVGVRSVVPLMACFLPAFVLIGVVPIIASLLKTFLS